MKQNKYTASVSQKILISSIIDPPVRGIPAGLEIDSLEICLRDKKRNVWFPCPEMFLVELPAKWISSFFGKKGGQAKSEAKTMAARENARKRWEKERAKNQEVK